MSSSELCYNRESIVEVLRDIEQIVVSLDRIGSSWEDLGEETAHITLSTFVTEWCVFRKLASARQVLSEPFSEELGPDDMDELEREMGSVAYWSLSHPAPPVPPPHPSDDDDR